MNDQASTLRHMTSGTATLNPPPIQNMQTRTVEKTRKEKNMHCLAITGGKGGVGKSNLAVNLSLELGALPEENLRCLRSNINNSGGSKDFRVLWSRLRKIDASEEKT